MERLKSDADHWADIAEDHRKPVVCLRRFVSKWQMAARNTSIGTGMSSQRVREGVEGCRLRQFHHRSRHENTTSGEKKPEKEHHVQAPRIFLFYCRRWSEFLLIASAVPDGENKRAQFPWTTEPRVSREGASCRNSELSSGLAPWGTSICPNRRAERSWDPGSGICGSNASIMSNSDLQNADQP
jgi:hypothetical protein